MSSSEDLRREFESLHAELRACRACPKMVGPPVHGAPVESEVFLLGQAPGPHEGKLGRPFAYTAGRTLFRWFEEATDVGEEQFRGERLYGGRRTLLSGQRERRWGSRTRAGRGRALRILHHTRTRDRSPESRARRGKAGDRRGARAVRGQEKFSSGGCGWQNFQNTLPRLGLRGYLSSPSERTFFLAESRTGKNFTPWSARENRRSSGLGPANAIAQDESRFLH